MAARTRTSTVVILGVGAGAILMAAIGAWRVLSGPVSEPVAQSGQAPSASTGELGIGPGAGDASADRPGETVQALATDIERLKSSNADNSEKIQSVIGSLGERVQQLADQVTALNSTGPSTDDALAGDALSSLGEQLRSEMRAMVSDLESRSGADDYPVTGGALPPGQGVQGADGYVWYAAATPDPEPAGAPSVFQDDIASLPDRLGVLSDSALGIGNPDDDPPEPLPAYTIPPDATLVRSRGLTALIGRVPFDGQVVDPFPFKIITGRRNLLANGQVLPELERAIWSGTATGDATLHCVTGQLQQVTFIFRDGTISTWPEADGGSGARGIGWISNERGYPCIPGEFVSNLQEKIASLTTASFASSLARAWSERQTTTTRDGVTVSREITGDPAEYALGQGIAGGIGEWSRIVAERAREAYDAVVVAPGQVLTVHVSEAIPIDWPPAGRRVRHVASSTAGGPAARPGGLD